MFYSDNEANYAGRETTIHSIQFLNSIVQFLIRRREKAGASCIKFVFSLLTWEDLILFTSWIWSFNSLLKFPVSCYWRIIRLKVWLCYVIGGNNEDAKNWSHFLCLNKAISRTIITFEQFKHLQVTPTQGMYITSLIFKSFIITCTQSFKRFQYVQGFTPIWNIFSPQFQRVNHWKSRSLLCKNWFL